LINHNLFLLTTEVHCLCRY